MYTEAARHYLRALSYVCLFIYLCFLFCLLVLCLCLSYIARVAHFFSASFRFLIARVCVSVSVCVSVFDPQRSMNPNVDHAWNYLRMTFACMERGDLDKLAAARDLDALVREFPQQ